MMLYEEIVAFLLCVLPQVVATSCMPKCGIPSGWLPVARNVCYGTKDNDFGRFTINRNCNLYAIRLVHVSGFQSSSKGRLADRSPWGYNNNGFICTLLLKDRQQFVPRKDLVNDFNDDFAYYRLDGFGTYDDVIVFRQNETLSTGQQLEIAFGLDFKDQYESLTEGTHCVDVDVSCYV